MEIQDYKYSQPNQTTASQNGDVCYGDTSIVVTVGDGLAPSLTWRCRIYTSDDDDGMMCRGDRQQMMEAAAADGSRPPDTTAPEDSRTGLIYNDDMGRADPFVGQKGPPPGEPQRWNYWYLIRTPAGYITVVIQLSVCHVLRSVS